MESGSIGGGHDAPFRYFEDGPIVAEMAKIGLVPGKDFDLAKLDPAIKADPGDSLPGSFLLLGGS